MIQALDYMLEAYKVLINTPHKTQRERSLIGNLYTQICLFGGQPFRTQMEREKVLASKALANPTPATTPVVSEETEQVAQTAGAENENAESPEKKNPVTPEPPSTTEAQPSKETTEKKKPGRKPGKKE